MSNSNEKTQYLRWTKVERIQHWILAGLFTLMVLTGFALRYPEAIWAKPLLIFESSFGFRSLAHRIAACLFIALGVYHSFYMLITRRGKMLTAAFLIRGQDLVDLRENLQFLFGKRAGPPAFDHFSYIEKIEYWALIWGSIIMTLTGFLLWFENLTLIIFPLWIFEIITIIHFYEAWLATLAVFVWHFYSTIFSPEIYPLNTSIIDGFISEKEMEKTHARELARLQAYRAESPGT